METLIENFNRKTVNTINVISNLCFDIQRRRLGTVFVDYSGHCNILHIRIYAGKWDSENTEIDQINNISIDHISLENNYRPERISLVINYLQNCLRANQILIPAKELLKLY